jgi:hypothetical protein
LNTSFSTSLTTSASTTSRRYVRQLRLATLGARRRTLTQTIGNARGLDINSPLNAENHSQDLRFHRHQQHGDPNSARGLDNNFASDRGCNSMIITRLRHRRLPLRPRRPCRTRQKLISPLPRVDFYLPFTATDTRGLRYEKSSCISLTSKKLWKP